MQKGWPTEKGLLLGAQGCSGLLWLGETHGSQTRLIIHVSLALLRGCLSCWNMTTVYRIVIYCGGGSGSDDDGID